MHSPDKTKQDGPTVSMVVPHAWTCRAAPGRVGGPPDPLHPRPHVANYNDFQDPVHEK